MPIPMSTPKKMKRTLQAWTQLPPTVVIAGLSGGSGKTLCTMGLVAALEKRGIAVAPFKKGPDFIDTAWLSRATTFPCRNLDAFLVGKGQTRRTYRDYGGKADFCVIEGNRGLFDGMDWKGSCSTAELAKLLGVPVILIVDCTKMTGTAAAMVAGCLRIDPRINLAGVILNRVAGKRHEMVAKAAIERQTGIPVIGALPKLGSVFVLERHLGLLPLYEHRKSEKVVEETRRIAEAYLDLDRLLKIVKPVRKPAVGTARLLSSTPPRPGRKGKPGKKVGVIRDNAFNFYYPENLEALEMAGAEIVEINALKDKSLPKVDLLYIGGGFPETQARLLERNAALRRSLKRAAAQGLRVYAECGGMVYLGRKLHYKGKAYSMSGILPVDFVFDRKPQGHGYTVLEIVKRNPFFPVGLRLKGHEFHYTRAIPVKKIGFSARVMRGFGIDGKQEGLVQGNVFATYSHLHAGGVKDWARRLLR